MVKPPGRALSHALLFGWNSLPRWAWTHALFTLAATRPAVPVMGRRLGDSLCWKATILFLLTATQKRERLHSTYLPVLARLNILPKLPFWLDMTGLAHNARRTKRRRYNICPFLPCPSPHRLTVPAGSDAQQQDRRSPRYPSPCWLSRMEPYYRLVVVSLNIRYAHALTYSTHGVCTPHRLLHSATRLPSRPGARILRPAARNRHFITSVCRSPVRTHTPAF